MIRPAKVNYVEVTTSEHKGLIPMTGSCGIMIPGGGHNTTGCNIHKNDLDQHINTMIEARNRASPFGLKTGKRELTVCRRRWPNIKPTYGQHLTFAGFGTQGHCGYGDNLPWGFCRFFSAHRNMILEMIHEN